MFVEKIVRLFGIFCGINLMPHITQLHGEVMAKQLIIFHNQYTHNLSFLSVSNMGKAPR